MASPSTHRSAPPLDTAGSNVRGVGRHLGNIMAKRRGKEPVHGVGHGEGIQLIGYLGHRSHDAIHIRARVLAAQALPEPGHSGWSRLRAMMALYDTRELENIAVRAEFGGQALEMRSDEDGHVKMRLPCAAPLPATTGWESVTLSAEAADGSRVEAAVPVIVPGSLVDVGVISDIDDTILETGTTNFVRNWRRVLIETSEERLSTPGAVKLYRALAGSASNPARPFFYISTSPWNLFAMLTRFKHLNGLPAGPMFLTRFDLTGRKLRFHRTVAHKSVAIDKVIEAYPAMRFLLIGDSAQHDILVYAQAIARFPRRFVGVIIRDVENRARLPDNQAQLAAIGAAGVPVFVAPALGEATDFLKAEGLGHLLVGADAPRRGV
jgi:phosphatidate phosphatase APP1